MKLLNYHQTDGLLEGKILFTAQAKTMGCHHEILVHRGFLADQLALWAVKASGFN